MTTKLPLCPVCKNPFKPRRGNPDPSPVCSQACGETWKGTKAAKHAVLMRKLRERARKVYLAKDEPVE